MFLCHFAVRAGILRVHPDLAGRIADIGRLTSKVCGPAVDVWTGEQCKQFIEAHFK